jgi:molecular chaperone DnaJ
LRLKGKGVPYGGGRGRGDQYIAINIAVPKGVDKRSKELFEELGKINPYEPRRGLW